MIGFAPIRRGLLDHIEGRKMSFGQASLYMLMILRLTIALDSNSAQEGSSLVCGTYPTVTSKGG